MNKYKEDELDAFLWEVETVSKQVKDILEGKADVDKLLEKERIKKEKLEKEEKLRKIKEEEERLKLEEKLRNGVKGKGEKDNYLKFCKNCFTEYEIEINSKCTHCNSELISKQQRHKELREKLEQLKEKKTKKIIRKQKYENWLKTESILKTTRVNFQNYHKWDLYESSTDEDEKGEPIVPRHDPNFLAMEKELIETEKKREISRNKSIKLKEEGNKMMKDGKFKKAAKLYTEAIEETKSMMVLYTNRALSYFKLEDYEASIADCDKVIEYLEIFEDQLQKNKETYVKAITRKALCSQKIKNFEEAKTLVAKALEYVKDEEIVKLQNNLLLEEEIHVKALNMIRGDSKAFEEITKFVELLQKHFEGYESQSASVSSDNYKNSTNNTCNNSDIQSNLISTTKTLLEKDENNRFFFIQKGGLELMFTKSALIKNISLIEIIEVFHRERDNRYIILINNIKGYNKLINLLFNKETAGKSDEINKNSPNIDSNNNKPYSYIKSLVSILEDASHNEEVRKTLSDLKEIEKLFQAALTQYDISNKTNLQNENVVIIIMHLFTFIGNLCYSANEIRQRICSTQSKTIMEKIYKFIEIFELNNILYRNVMETVLSFLINLSCNDEFRQSLGRETMLLKFLISAVLSEIMTNLNNNNKLNSNSFKKNFDELLEKICCLLFNLTISNNQATSNKLIESYIELGIVNILQNYVDKLFLSSNIKSNENFEIDFKSCYTSETSLLRIFMITTKITKQFSNLFDVKFYNQIIKITNLKILKIGSNFVDNQIKILAHYFQNLNNLVTLNKNEIMSKLELKLLITNLKEIFVFDYPKVDSSSKERIINNMSLMISLISNRSNLAENLKEIVKYLIEIAKEKMDLLRKNSAILLAKIAKSSTSMESIVRELHGMDVLMNVAKFIQLNK